METDDAHATYPILIYRQCDSLTSATRDASTIEAVTSMTLFTMIKSAWDLQDSSNGLLATIHGPLGRCVAVMDDKVEAL